MFLSCLENYTIQLERRVKAAAETYTDKNE
jgi:hypothetical protein